MKPIKVVIQGVSGRMGQVIFNGLYRESDIEVVGATEVQVEEDRLLLPGNAGTIPFSSDLDNILISCQPDVVVDFTTAQATRSILGLTAKREVNLVIGTTGLTAADFNEMERLIQAHQIGIVVTANFSLGAVMIMHLAKVAAKHFDYAEIIELHHHLKADAPSGTALTTARAMSQARGNSFKSPPEEGKTQGSRGEAVEGIAIHSVRLPGLMAHQEVIMGAAGQTLSIRHDTINRECYLPGIILSIKEVVKRKGLISDLSTLLNL